MDKNKTAAAELRRYEKNLEVSGLKFAKDDVVPEVLKIVDHIKKTSKELEIGDLEYTGSIYQNLKVNETDEFDFDIPIKAFETDHVQPGPTKEYATFGLDGDQQHLRRFANKDGQLSAERMIQHFFGLVEDATRGNGSVSKVEINHPAVTVTFKKNGKEYDVDLAPTIGVTNWPDNLTLGWQDRKRHGWPSQELINEIKEGTVSLVAKPPKGREASQMSNREAYWRYSFNKAEKRLILDPGTQNNCRRSIIRVLKGMRLEYNWPCIRSHHLKTFMLHQFESYPPNHWSDEMFLPRLKESLKRLEDNLRQRKCQHYFLRDINLFKDFDKDACERIIQDIEHFLKDPVWSLQQLNKGYEEQDKKQRPIQMHSSTSFTISVIDLKRRTENFTVFKQQKISELKDQISKRFGVDQSQFNLVFNGKNLTEGTIQSNEINEGNKVYMMIRLRGG